MARGSGEAGPGRRVTAVVIDGAGRALGALPVLDVADPWWPDTRGVVAGLRAVYGIEATVVRLLEGRHPLERGGEVTYAVELAGAPPHELPLRPATGIPLGSDSDPRRMPWARSGGVAADLAWADTALAALHRPRTGPADQIRSWNLSLLLRMPTATGPVWLKHVPWFMGHEGRILELLAGAGEVPTLLAADHDQGRWLIDGIPGADAYDPPPELALRMVAILVRLQAGVGADVERVLSTGCPDWRGPALLAAVGGLAARDDVRVELGAEDRRALDRLITGLPGRLESLAACGLPDTLVHGDFHPGNCRADGARLTLLDWGDAGAGHPLLDVPAFCETLPEEQLRPVRDAWAAAWRDACPGADPARAMGLIAPVAALRQALIYRNFLDAIEPAEHVYHRAEMAPWLRTAVRLAAEEET